MHVLLIFFLWLHLIIRRWRLFDQAVFSLSLIRPHLIFCMQPHLRNMWSQWWSSPMRMNRSNRTMMTTTRSHSSRLATPPHPVSRHSHKYGTRWVNAHHPAQYNHDGFYLCSKWIYLIRHSDPQMEDLTTGEFWGLSLHLHRPENPNLWVLPPFWSYLEWEIYTHTEKPFPHSYIHLK